MTEKQRIEWYVYVKEMGGCRGISARHSLKEYEEDISISKKCGWQIIASYFLLEYDIPRYWNKLFFLCEDFATNKIPLDELTYRADRLGAKRLI